jgi:FAD:protein FMN transferase
MTRVAHRSGGATASTQTWAAFGTTALLCTAGGDWSAARSAVQREIDEMDAAASRFASASELSQVNRACGRRVPISERLLEALQLALRAAAVTDGAVDPTLGGRLIELGYDRDWKELERVRPDEPIDRGAPRRLRPRRAVWRSIELWEDPPAVRIPADARLDLGATAKALAADRGARAAALAGGDGVLLSLGGDIATCGTSPPGGWLVRVTDDHRDGASSDGQTITIASGGLATSSLVPRRWYQGGRAVHHVLDPHTGQPVDPVWRTASVAAATCAEANIASTAALVMGAGAPPWLARQNLPARLVARDGTVTRQGGWPP